MRNCDSEKLNNFLPIKVADSGLGYLDNKILSYSIMYLLPKTVLSFVPLNKTLEPVFNSISKGLLQILTPRHYFDVTTSEERILTVSDRPLFGVMASLPTELI